MNQNIKLKPQETLWVQYVQNGITQYIIITKNRLRETYHLCKVQDGKITEIAKSNNPVDLDKKVQKLSNRKED